MKVSINKYKFLGLSTAKPIATVAPATCKYKVLLQYRAAHKPMFKYQLIFSIVLLIITNCLQLQAQSNNKVKFFFNWGWNRAAYTKSTLQMQGYDYNLTLYKLKATDRPTAISYYNYLKLNRITIPQTNVRLGYYIKKNKALVLGIDHMKYIMTQNQNAKVVGAITRPGAYQKSYNTTMPITNDFLTFEHTDGLNYINLGMEHYGNVTISKSGNHNIEWILGTNAGILVPKTNVKFLDYNRTDKFHWSGLGIAAKAGLQYIWLKHIVLRTEVNTGYIYMPNIILHKTGIDGKAKQNFAYVQGNVQIGYRFSVSK
jgi:hypothetical protein